MSIYQELCKKYGININTRWEDGVEHHHEASQLLRECYDLDYTEYEDHFGWNVGGDGDNGEILIEQMSVLFDIRDAVLADKYPHAYTTVLKHQDGATLLDTAMRIIEEGKKSC